jgi:hypothetical protein
MRDRADLEGIHRHSSHHREVVERSERCGCFSCEAIFSPGEITDWVGWPGGDEDAGPGQTALCPRCGIDAVLPSAAPNVDFSPELLAEMRRHWFSAAT